MNLEILPILGITNPQKAQTTVTKLEILTLTNENDSAEREREREKWTHEHIVVIYFTCVKEHR